MANQTTTYPRSLGFWWLTHTIPTGVALILTIAPPSLSLEPPDSVTSANAPIASLVQQGQMTYQSGDWPTAIAVWSQVLDQMPPDSIPAVIASSYLGLIYQQQGQATQAKAAMARVQARLHNPSSPVEPGWRAKLLNQQGQYALNQNNSSLALELWQQATVAYQKAGDSIGAIGSQLNQAIALKSLGLHIRAKTLLEQIAQAIAPQPNSTLKASILLSLGTVLSSSGNLTLAQQQLEQSRVIAQQIGSVTGLQAAQLQLGINAETRGDPATALALYQQAAQVDGAAQLAAILRLLRLRIKQPDAASLTPLLKAIRSRLNHAPPNQQTLYAQIEFAHQLTHLSPQQLTPDLRQEAAQRFLQAAEQAKQWGNLRAESYALGRLATLYEQSQQWSLARSLTEQALMLTEAIQAPEIAYQWQWQLGRILKAEGQSQQAIAAYQRAIQLLQTLRNDLAGINQSAQFSFQDQIEPVYRELAALLLDSESPSQTDLQQARQAIEALQVAELTNYFREPCLTEQPQPIEQIDPTAAIFYPIILPDRLEVIVSLPNQPLKRYTTPLPATQVETTVQKMRQSLRSTSFESERLPLAQQLYQWLIQPAIADLQRHQIQTLAFVLDGELRNIPMAALHSGQRYLIEDYRLAVTPGLRLLKAQSLAEVNLNPLIAGLSEGRDGFSPLPGVAQEVQQIAAQFPSSVLMNQDFTASQVAKRLQSKPFSIVHLATHARFSSNPSETYIQTWDGRLTVNELADLISQRAGAATAIELLVLSACQTAKGDKQAALGIAGVAVRSGARSTLATLWTVSDLSTAALMTEFYHQLNQPQVNRAEALRLAQLSLLRNPASSHPYYWAAFILVGNWL